MKDILIDRDQILSVMAEATLKRFKDKMEGYQSPLEPIIADAFKVNSDAIRAAIYKATAECVNSPDFATQLVQHLNHKLANLVINKCSGLVEKSFQGLMQDAVLRNKLQAAVIEIINTHAKAAQ
ncbi:MAG TPA: hypothetical protein VLC51_04605 [Nitrospira sp.]|nr:hypothetical protein [Nitrospira sp.]